MNLESAVEGYPLFKVSRASSETVKTDRSQINQFLPWYGPSSVETVSAANVRQYLQHHRNRGLSPHTIRRHHAALSAFYK